MPGRRIDRAGGLLLRALLALLPVLAPALTRADTARVFAVAHSPYAAPALVAQANGYFAAEGLSITLTRCDTGQVCLRSLLGGQADFATVADAPIAVASFERHDFGVVASMTRSGDELRILTRRDRGVRSLDELRGRRVGVIAGTSAHYYLETALRYAGLRMADVTLVPLDAADPTGPLLAGGIDAAALFDPFLGRAARQLGDNAALLPPLNFFRMSFNVVAAGGGKVDDPTVRRLLRALRRACDFIHGSPGAAQAIVARAAGLGEADVAAAWPHYRFGLNLEQGLVSSLEGHMRWAQRAGLSTRPVLPDVLELIRAEPLAGVDAAAVRILK